MERVPELLITWFWPHFNPPTEKNSFKFVETRFDLTMAHVTAEEDGQRRRSVIRAVGE